MGKLFSNLNTAEAERSQDRVGGGYEPFSSNVYDGVITLAYAGKAQSSNAQNVTLHVNIGGKEYRETIYITNRNGEPTFPDKDDPKKKIQLPGFSLIDDICMFATEQPLAAQDTQTKTVKLYNYQEKKEMNTEVPMLIDLLGKPIKLAILEVDEPVQERGPDGIYRDTDKRRKTNQIEKAMHPETGRTINEYMQDVQTPEYMTAWLEKNQGKPRIKKASNAPVAGSTGSGSPFGGGEKKASSLFKKG